MCKTTLSKARVAAVVAVLLMLLPTASQGALTPDDVWTFDWETYVDLQPSNSNVLSTNWDFTTHKWEEVYVDGDGVDNVGDTDEHQGEAAEGYGDNLLGLDQLTMTLTGLDPNTSYSIDAVLMSEAGNDADEWGVTAGFTSGLGQVEYNCVDRTAAHIDRALNNEWLARVPLGTTTSDGSGQITVYFNENGSLDWSADSLAGTVVDGLIFHKPSEAAPLPTRLITSADRKNGVTDDDLPIGPHDGDTDPLPSDDYGLRLGARTFSDRVYHVDDISDGLVGADYVRNFLNDKADDGDFSYDVTLTTTLDEVFLMVLIDDRFELGAGEQQAMVDTIVAGFANAGDFVDTGHDIDLTDSGTSHPLSAFGMMVDTKDSFGNPITYTFGAVPNGSTGTYFIAALEEAPAPPVQIPGDTNRDGVVDADDAANLAANWGNSVDVGDYTKGDFNKDGVVDLADASILAANWTGSGGYGESATVPEPGAAVLLWTAVVGVIVWRRRRAADAPRA